MTLSNLSRPLFAALAAAACMGALARTAPQPAEDPRQYMHGIAAVEAEAGAKHVFFSSSGLPPRGANANGSWPHDVYVTRWHADSGLVETPRVFIAKPEAQEPVSAAQNLSGNVMLTFEDGWNVKQGGVTQRYGVYDRALRPVSAYPQEVEPGGHSGHVAAVGDAFVVFYSDGWIDGGGVDDLGSGNGVYAKVYDGRNRRIHDVDVADNRREWWPMIAGGAQRALLVWQKFEAGRTTATLKRALLDPVTGRVSAVREGRSLLQYYTYNAAWLPAIERFLVVGTANGRGFAELIDEAGETRAELPCMPATVREGGIAVAGGVAYTPAADGRLLRLDATGDRLALTGVLKPADGAPGWSTVGSVGLTRRSGEMDWLSLTDKGLRQLRFDPADASDPSDADLCR